MDADDFFSRWSRRNKEPESPGIPAAPAGEPANRPVLEPDVPARPAAEDLPPPSMEDVERLTGDSDFSRFMGREVDETVKRSAMKKLFSNPRYNVMDGLDVYIEDYNKFVPMTPEVLASLEHAKSLLDPLKHLEKPVMRVIDKVLGQVEPGAATASAEAARVDAAGPNVAGADVAEGGAVPPPDADRIPAADPAGTAAPASGSDPGVEASSAHPHDEAAPAADNSPDHSDPSHEHPI